MIGMKDLNNLLGYFVKKNYYLIGTTLYRTKN